MSRFVSWLPIAVSDRHARRVGGDRILRPLLCPVPRHGPGERRDQRLDDRREPGLALKRGARHGNIPLELSATQQA